MASIITGPKARGYQLAALRTLDMEILCFSPDFLSLLAHGIPQLQSLKLVVADIGPDKDNVFFARNRVPEVSQPSFYLLPENNLCMTVLRGPAI
jgi:hypothetical protein